MGSARRWADFSHPFGSLTSTDLAETAWHKLVPWLNSNRARAQPVQARDSNRLSRSISPLKSVGTSNSLGRLVSLTRVSPTTARVQHRVKANQKWKKSNRST